MQITYRIGYSTNENQSHVHLVVLWGSAERTWDWYYNKSCKGDPFPSKLVWNYVSHAFAYNSTNPKDHHGQLGKKTAFTYQVPLQMMTLQWRHNGPVSVSNHQHHDWLLNRLFRRRPKKISTLLVTGLCAGNSPGTGEFPAQMASYAENVSGQFLMPETRENWLCIVNIMFTMLTRSVKFTRHCLT